MKKENHEKKIKNYIEKHPKLTMLILFVGIPFSSYVLSEATVLPVCGNNDWAGFWGGYLGAIIGGVITLYVMRHTMEKEKELQESSEKLTEALQVKNEKIEYFDKLIEIVAQVLQSADRISAYIKRAILNDCFVMSDEYLNNVSELYVMANRFRLMLVTRNEIYDISELKYAYNEFFEEMKYLKEEYAQICVNKDKDILQINSLGNRNMLEEKTKQLQKSIETTAKRNIYGIE